MRIFSALQKLKAPQLILFPLALFYWELVFALTVFGSLSAAAVVRQALLSAACGLVLALLCNLLPSAKAVRVSGLVILVLAVLPFGVEGFVYQQFKVLYDVTTVASGAGGVATGFTRDVGILLTSGAGMRFLIALLLPIALYFIFALIRKKGSFLPLRGKAWAGAAAVLLLICTGAFGVIRTQSAAWECFSGNSYNFETAVRQFGLLPGLALDMRYRGQTSRTPAFETVAAEATAAPSAATEETQLQEQETVYGKNELDLPLDSCVGEEQTLAEYVSTLTASSKNEYTGIFAGKNLIFFSAEAFCAEAIDPERTPTLYRLANSCFQFTDYYQPNSAGTTGGEVQNLLGLLPTSGGNSMFEATSHRVMDMATFLTPLGYTGGAFHANVSGFYNRKRTHNRLGYPDGFLGYGEEMSAFVTAQWPQSDLELLQGTLPAYLEQDEPFNLYYMTVSGHSIYVQGSNAMVDKHYDEVADLDYPEKIKCYLAAQQELEDTLTYVLQALEDAGKLEDTVICISSDHFPYGLDDSTSGGLENLSTLYGYEVTTKMERDHNRLILWCGALEGSEIVVDEPVSSLDILPTLCNLFGVDFDSRLMVGRDVFSDAEPLVFNLTYDWITALGSYENETDTFTPSDSTAEIPEGYVERISTTVRNKIRYCQGILATDFFGTLLGKTT